MTRKNNQYFEDFISMINYSCQAAEYLQALLQDFDADKQEEQRIAMYQLEAQEDELKHSMMVRLTKEFVPPIGREDIIKLSNDLDDITDKIKEIPDYLYMYKISKGRPAALSYAEIIEHSCKTLKKALTEFPEYKRSNRLMSMLIEVHSIEEVGNQLYIESVRELYEKGGDTNWVAGWNRLFDLFRECCIACERAAETIEMIIIKNL